MPPAYVKPYVKRQKNDMAEAEVICEAGDQSQHAADRGESQAQRHCPADVVVWLDFREGIYYSRRQRRYARDFAGSFVCRQEARTSGYRRSLFGLR
jgi:hypothetical protein